MDLGLKGKVAIVGGGSMGIGFGIASRLAQEGADLVIFARRMQKLEAAASDLSSKFGVRVVPVSADIRDKDESARIVQTANLIFW
jgi:3-oxoacyl-[acyl-carrier protein] reductase